MPQNNSKKIRLQKLLSQRGVASRRVAEELIRQGRVKVNGKVINEMGVRVDPEKDLVEVDGKEAKTQELVYILFNKPAGYVTTCTSKHKEDTVMDLVKVKERVFPVGRLDKDTEGLLLLTNDGALTHKLTHPSFEHEKEYLVRVAKEISDNDLAKLEKGVELEDGLSAPARTERTGLKEFHLKIHEGRKRQIKRMLEAVGNQVVYLQRLRMGAIELGHLAVGEWRYLKKSEVNELRK